MRIPTCHLSKRRFRNASIGLIIGLLLPSLSPFVGQAHATTGILSLASLRADRMTASQANRILVVVKPTSAITETSVNITFASAYTVAATGAGLTASTAGIPPTIEGVSLTALPGMGAITSAGKTVSVVCTDLLTTNTYAFFITAGITNPAVSGNYSNLVYTGDAGMANSDQQYVGTYVMSGVNADQVVITAVVPPILTIALSTNSLTFPNSPLDASTVNTSNAVTVTMGTNASHGWSTWFKGANNTGGLSYLHSTYANQNINSMGTLTAGYVDGVCVAMAAGTSAYGAITANAVHGTGTGTITLDPEYSCPANQSGSVASEFQELAYSNGTGNNDTFTVASRVSLTNIQMAANDYTDTWTFVAAANF